MSSCLEIYENVETVDTNFFTNHYRTIAFSQLLSDMDIDTGTPFSYIRLGDQEWRFILHGLGVETHDNFLSIDERLGDILRDNPSYYVSFSYKLFKTTHIHDEVVNWVSANNVTIKFVQDDMFNSLVRYSQGGYLDFLRNILRDTSRHIVLIGNENLGNINAYDEINDIGMFTPTHTITVLKRNCYLTYDSTKTEIENYINSHVGEKIMFMFCCGPMAPILIHDLNATYGGQHWLIDLGSFFDIFAGFASRTPSICDKERLYDMYRPCFLPSMPSVDNIINISPSLI